MKKSINILIMSILILLCTTTLMAQDKPYKASIGGIIGTFEGVSFKMFITPHLTFGADLGWDWTYTPLHYTYGSYSFSRSGGLITLEINPYLAYQGNIIEFGAGRLDWFAGGGLSGGYLFNNGGKFGINAIGGIEFTFSKIPLTLQGDFRPGFGLAFANDRYNNIRYNYHFGYFDWAIGISARYTFK